MARGWESKAVESQQEEHARGKGAPVGASAEQRSRTARRQTLLLQRAKAQADLARATKPGHRAMLEQAIEEIGRQLRDIGA